MSFREPSAEKKTAHSEKLSILYLAYKTNGSDSAWKAYSELRNTCPECGGTDHRMENYSMMWHEADIVCNGCDTYVRGWDAG